MSPATKDPSVVQNYGSLLEQLVQTVPDGLVSAPAATFSLDPRFAWLNQHESSTIEFVGASLATFNQKSMRCDLSICMSQILGSLAMMEVGASL